MSNSIAASLSQYPSFVNDLTQYLNSTLSSLLPDTDSLPDLVTYITSLLSDADSAANAQSLSEALQPFLEDSTASVVEQLLAWCETEVKQIKEQEKRAPNATAANGNRQSTIVASASPSIAPVTSPVAFTATQPQQQQPNASPNPAQHQPTRKRRGDDEETDEPSDLDQPLPSSAKRSKGEDGLPRAQQQQPTKTCFDFNRTGNCSRGAQCRYSHSMPNNNGMNGNGNNTAGFRNPNAPWMNQGMPNAAMNPQQMMMQQRQFQMMMAMQQQQAMQMQFMQQQQLQAAAAAAAAKPSAGAATASSATPSAHSSCKVLLSKLPASLYNSAALTEWLESMGDVVNTRAVAPDQCVVQFRTHEDARSVYESQDVAGNKEVKKQWIVPRGTKAEASSAAAANGNQPPVIQIERKGGKPITVKRKSKEDVEMTPANPATTPLNNPLAFMPIMTPSSFGFPNAMAMMQPGGAFPKKSFAAAASSAPSQPQKPAPKSALDVAALIAQRKSVSAPSASSVATPAAPTTAASAVPAVIPGNKLSGTPLASLKSLLTQTELMHTKLSNIANESNASIRTTLLKKIDDIKAEINRKEKLESGVTSSPTISSASSSNLPAALQLPSPHSNPLLARSSSFPSSPGSASGSPSPSRPLTPQENALRAKKESAAKKAAADKESKRKLDMEMDQIKKESQLATISEAD